MLRIYFVFIKSRKRDLSKDFPPSEFRPIREFFKFSFSSGFLFALCVKMYGLAPVGLFPRRRVQNFIAISRNAHSKFKVGGQLASSNNLCLKYPAIWVLYKFDFISSRRENGFEKNQTYALALKFVYCISLST